MHPTGPSNIAHATFRANPNYELVLFDRLTPEHRAQLRDLTKDPDFYGILRPQSRLASGIKAVCRDTALLFLTLREPGALPAYVQARLGEHRYEDIAQLVLDGVLEIECRHGMFVSGVEAYEHLYGQPHVRTGQGAIARLSIEALQYAQALDLTAAAELSVHIYCYNRHPITPAWVRRFPNPDAVAEHLGINPGGRNARTLERRWCRASATLGYRGWLVWEPHHSHRDLSTAYKLYISPRCEAVRDVFGATLAALSASSAPPFKIGKDVYGLLRPDKIVVYFAHLEELQEVADRVRREIDGAPAHGVPFSAEIAGAGLLSWGMDPPPERQMLGWQGGESWRLWVTNRLATFLLAAKTSPAKTIEPWKFALERLRLDGVDTTSWTPAATIWTGRSAVER